MLQVNNFFDTNVSKTQKNILKKVKKKLYFFQQQICFLKNYKKCSGPRGGDGSSASLPSAPEHNQVAHNIILSNIVIKMTQYYNYDTLSQYYKNQYYINS